MNEDEVAAFDGIDQLTREHPLFEAIVNGNTARAGSLLAKDPKISRMRGRFQGFTPLHVAVVGGEMEIAQLLVRAGADVNARAVGDLTPLHCAAMRGNLEIAIFLMDHGADPGATTSNGGKTNGIANMKGHKHLARVLYLAEELPKKKGKHLTPRQISDALKRGLIRID